MLGLKQGRGGYFRKNLKLLRTKLRAQIGDTVGALALDGRGNVAAACSTGGVLLKLPGRIGDSAIMGAGLYADNQLGAATATGIGELAIRSVLSKTTVEMMKSETAQNAGVEAVRIAGKRIGTGIGLITLDKRGEFGAAHDTTHLCWAMAANHESKAHIIGKRLQPHP